MLSRRISRLDKHEIDRLALAYFSGYKARVRIFDEPRVQTHCPAAALDRCPLVVDAVGLA